jgi:hypothetical protein
MTKHLRITSRGERQNSADIAAQIANARHDPISKVVFVKVRFDDTVVIAWIDFVSLCCATFEELQMIECFGPRLDILLQTSTRKLKVKGMLLSVRNVSSLNTALVDKSSVMNSLDMEAITFEESEDSITLLAMGLQINTSLDTFRIPYCYLPDQQMSSLLQALAHSHTSSFRELSLTANQIEEETLEATLRYFLGDGNKLERLELGYVCNGRNEPWLQLEIVARYLRGSQSLKVLNLEGSALGDDDLALLAQVLPTCPQLEDLDLRENSFSYGELEGLLWCNLPRTLARLNVATNTETSFEEDDRFALQALNKYPRLTSLFGDDHSWNNGSLESEIEHLADFNRCGRILFCEQSILPLSVWPVVLGRANGLFQDDLHNLRECVRKSQDDPHNLRECVRKSANVIFHMLRNTQPTGTLLSVLVQKGKLAK